jgi:putative ABC transport system permease protein
MSTATFEASFARHDNEFTLVKVPGGTTDANTARLDKALVAFPNAEIETREQFKSRMLGPLTRATKILYALLGLSVIVSLFGVINTLVLSVFERTREIGMLCAIGMNRPQAAILPARRASRLNVLTALQYE